MKTIRKIDFYGQLILGIAMLVSIPFLFLYGFLLGFFFLVCWQLFSASFNTSAFTRSGFKKKIITYWKWAAADLLILLFCFRANKLFTSDLENILVTIGLGGSVIIAVYYLYIYHMLISRIEFKNELSGFLK